MRLLLLLAISIAAIAQPTRPPLDDEARLKWFTDAKFGVFIHWGPYSVIGRHEWARHRFQIPQAEYDKYARAFNPEKFNADEWMGLFDRAGAKYVVITSKHHDGFSIWRSKVSDYDMEISPYKGDPLKDLAAAARKRDLRFGFYHSIMDWHHPAYRPRRAWEAKNPKEGGNNGLYVDFMKEQLRELLTGYGDVAVIWFDGEWEHTLAELKRDDEVYDFIRLLQPNTLINDRLYERKPGSRGDFGTPEQFVPATGVKDPSGRDALWESCVTINMDSWGYNKYETEFKTERDLIRMLVEVVSKGGNLLLNVGPKPDGTIQTEFVTRLEAMGQWLKANGESIYGTKASPFARLPFFGRATQKGNLLYLNVFAWPTDGQLRVPGLKNLVNRAYLLADADKKPLKWRRDGADILLDIPAEAPDDRSSVVVMQLDGAPVVEPYLIRPDEKGRIHLGVESSEIETRFEQRAKKENALGHVYLTKWSRADDIPTWKLAVPKAGRYRVEVSYGSTRAGVDKEYQVSVGGQAVNGKIVNTGGEWVFQSQSLGTLSLAAGEQTLQVKSASAVGLDGVTLEKVVLVPVN
ncbi:MAG: alpha-L-fucosidase [Bryobacter sp.]|nr:alpha-L-fucosidase [Bryobacter sp.]